jgi:hypothetical protein
MKKSMSILCIALMAMGTTAFAQGNMNANPGPEVSVNQKQGKGMMKDLNLTEDQKAKMKVLHEEFAVKDSIAKVERQKAFESILTKDQLDQLHKMKEQTGPGFAGGMGMAEKGPGREFGMECGAMPKDAPQASFNNKADNGDRFQKRAGQEDFPNMNEEPQSPEMQMEGMPQRSFSKRGYPQMGQNDGAMRAEMGPARHGKFAKKEARMSCKQAKMEDVARMVNPEERIKNQVERMTKQLNLTSEQASKIQDIQKKYAKKEIARYQKIQKKLDARMKTQNACRDEIKLVLTEEQVKKYDTMKEKAAPCMPEKESPKLDEK